MRFSPYLAATAIITIFSGLRAQSPAIDAFVAMRAPVIALAHVSIIDRLGHPPLENQTVIIRDGKLAHLGAENTTPIPDGAAIRDLTGKMILQSVVTLHEHLYYSSIIKGPLHMNEKEFSFPKLSLATGVTSARTTGSLEPYTDLHVNAGVDAVKIPGPKLHLTAPYVDGAGTGIAQLHAVKSAAEAVRMANYWADEGFTSVKVYLNLPADIRSATVTAAHQRGLHVTSHLGKTGYREAALAGIDNLEHGFMAMSDLITEHEIGDASNATANSRSLEAPAPDTLNDSLAFGKAADLIVVNGDPSTDISDLRKAEIVFQDGTGYDSPKLFAAVNGLVGIH